MSMDISNHAREMIACISVISGMRQFERSEGHDLVIPFLSKITDDILDQKLTSLSQIGLAIADAYQQFRDIYYQPRSEAEKEVESVEFL